MQKSALLIEDEKSVATIIQAYLEKESFKVYYAENGVQARDIMMCHKVSIIVLDLMLPDISGEELCCEFRQCSNIPIIMLTAKSSEQEKLNGFACGADDYIIKPFSPKELVARVNAVLRRSDKACHNMMNFIGGLSINLHTQAVAKNSVAVYLTPSEYKILMVLINNAGKIISRDALLDSVFTGGDVYDRTVDAHIKNIRQKIEEDTKKPLYIHTEYGLGYRFDEKTLD